MGVTEPEASASDAECSDTDEEMNEYNKRMKKNRDYCERINISKLPKVSHCVYMLTEMYVIRHCIQILGNVCNS